MHSSIAALERELGIARRGQIDNDFMGDPARMRREHDDAVGEKDRFCNRMSDK